MNLQNLQTVEKFDFYLDIAFRNANKRAGIVRESSAVKRLTRLEKSKKIELVKLAEIKKVLTRQFERILSSFPSIDTLPEFYQELIRVMLDYVELKKSLGSLSWAIDKIEMMYRLYSTKIKKIKYNQQISKINVYRREYYGRISSIVKQIKKSLKYLEHSRKVLIGFPNIKTKIPTVCIVGFPNVGKTTLLFKLTGSKPEIAPYAFTTKGLNVGYIRTGIGKTNKIQFIDTPGTLNRFDKMNVFEKQAYLAVKYCADLIVYVFDLTESYKQFPIEKQIKLYQRLKKEFEKPIVIYLSKTDLVEKSVVDNFIKQLKTKRIKKIFTDIYKLKDEIMESVK